MPKRKSYLISAGNSTTGPVGFCIRVRAFTKKQAMKAVRAALPESIDVRTDASNVEYAVVYFNTDALTIKDIDDGETEILGEE